MSWYFLGYVVFGYVYAVWYLPRVRAWDADQNPNKPRDPVVIAVCFMAMWGVWPLFMLTRGTISARDWVEERRLESNHKKEMRRLEERQLLAEVKRLEKAGEL